MRMGDKAIMAVLKISGAEFLTGTEGCFLGNVSRRGNSREGGV